MDPITESKLKTDVQSTKIKAKLPIKKITLCDKCNEPTGTIHYRCDMCDVDTCGGWQY